MPQRGAGRTRVALHGCGHDQIAYNSCRNRHCPKCQASAAQRWLEARQADLFPVDYYHVVFTLPAPISAIAYYNKAVIYGLLFEIAAETLLHHRGRSQASGRTDRRNAGAAHLGLGADAPSPCAWHRAGRRLSPDGERWIACRPGFFLSVRVLSRLFRRRFLEALEQAHRAGRLQFFGEYAALADRARLRRLARAAAQVRMGGLCQAPVRRTRGGAGLSVALHPPRRHLQQPAGRMDERGVTFRWKDYRAKGRTRYKTMTLDADEFMRRFLLHVLPGGFHRIRHYGLLANGNRKGDLACVRELLLQPAPSSHADLCRVISRRNRAAEVRLPALRWSDDHPGDHRSRAIDPRTASTSEGTVSSTLHHRPVPISTRHPRSRCAVVLPSNSTHAFVARQALPN